MKVKTLLLAGAAALGFTMAATFTAPTPASAASYVGDWAFDDNPGGWEILLLGDNSDGSIRILRGTEISCGPRGASYATMRNILRRNGTNGEQISWWEDRSCDNGAYLRVCIENWRGEGACSTYEDQGWEE